MKPFLLLGCFCLLIGLPDAFAQLLPPPAPNPPTAHLEELETALGAFDRQHPEREKLPERTLVPFAMLQLKKARLMQKRGYRSRSRQSSPARIGLAALQVLKQGKSLLARPGRLSEHAYITTNDATVQPYYLYLPKTYDPAKKWPLLVFLHGYVGSIDVLDPWILSEDAYEIADRHGFVLLTVYGRRNTDFQGVGEVDVEEATREVRDLYSIDPDRIHLTGVSMGGAGAYYIGLRRPGAYASYTGMDGQSDMHAWWPRLLPGWPRDIRQIPPYRRWLVEWDNAIDLVMNARNQNYFILHGEKDPMVSVEQSRKMVAAATALDIPMKYEEIKGVGHFIYFESGVLEKAWSWQVPLKREPSPQRITYKTFSLEYDRAFWCRIVDFQRWGVPAVIDGAFSPDGTKFTAKTENIRSLEIDAKTAPREKGKKIFQAEINGKPCPVEVLENGICRIVCDSSPIPEPSFAGRKRHGMSGPVEEAFDHPFTVVVGTSGTKEQNALNEKRAEKWMDEWDRFADGRPPMVTDTQVDDKLIAERGLILFGSPESNAILKRVQSKLPIKVGEQSYEVAGKTYAGNDLGLVMCYPNPLNPKRYIVVYAGELYGERCGINHKHDLIPDFVVFNNRNFNYDDTNQHEVAGFFNMNWQLEAGLTDCRKK